MKPGTQRFEVRLPDPDTLMFKWQDQREMLFRRNRGMMQTDLDFYGGTKAAGNDDFYNHADIQVTDLKKNRG